MGNDCNHRWIEKERDKRVKSMSPGFLSTVVAYEMKILQECEKCKKYNVVVF